MEKATERQKILIRHLNPLSSSPSLPSINDNKPTLLSVSLVSLTTSFSGPSSFKLRWHFSLMSKKTRFWNCWWNLLLRLWTVLLSFPQWLPSETTLWSLRKSLTNQLFWVLLHFLDSSLTSLQGVSHCHLQS